MRGQADRTGGQGGHAELRGVWLYLARGAWLAVQAATLFVFLWAIPARYLQLLEDPYRLQAGLAQLGLSVRAFAVYGTALDMLAGLTFVTVAVILALRKFNDWMVLLTSTALTLFLVTIIPVSQALALGDPAWHLPLLSLRALGLFTLGVVLYIFPDGRFVPRWTRWLTGLLAVYCLLWFVYPDFIPPTAFTEFTTPVERARLGGMIVWFVTVLIGQAYRYRYLSNPAQRQQTKWVVFGLVVAFSSMGLLIAPLLIFPALNVPGVPQTLFLLVAIPLTLALFSIFPFSLAIATARYKLWDIEALINRSLVYAGVTGALALVCSAGVFLIKALFPTQTPLATVLATLAIATLFNPLRRRMQDFIDWRFYRKKYDAGQTLARFAAAARDEVDMDRLTDALMGVVEETMQPESATMWLPGEKMKNIPDPVTP